MDANKGTPLLVVVVGPTAVGKSALAVRLAQHLGAEIVSGDSVQIYQELSIGAAKPTVADQGGVVHHLIDVLRVGEPYSVADFQREVRAKIHHIRAQGKPVVLCGGTGFYVKAALYDYVFDHAARDAAFERAHATTSNEDLHRDLMQVDPKSARKFHPNNRLRVLRALGYYHTHGALISAQSNRDTLWVDNVRVLGLSMDRARLYERIDARVDAMLAQGLLEEARGLVKKQSHIQAIGYNELFDYLNGRIDYDTAVRLIKQHSRQLAKRQCTWFRNQMNGTWLDATDQSLDRLFKEAMQAIAQRV
jgi:tRNA dimethylallyltransferase